MNKQKREQRRAWIALEFDGLFEVAAGQKLTIDLKTGGLDRSIGQ
jgi:hypothetical protein